MLGFIALSFTAEKFWMFLWIEFVLAEAGVEQARLASSPGQIDVKGTFIVGRTRVLYRLLGVAVKEFGAALTARDTVSSRYVGVVFPERANFAGDIAAFAATIYCIGGVSIGRFQ